ncbi:hypothetical protein [Lentibacillus sediminis]|uniref:hypothetical protein n=1 Tax=Lentibacillus sediminis TaxID=1940529 RepID=UPI000C1C0094|nr:hypothetical protein [Lentibacillus sediminis]
MLIIGALILPFFIYALVTEFKLLRSDESKDKKEQILAYSSKYALGVFPIGWVILHLYHNFIASIPYETYRDAMWVLLLLLVTVHGFAINFYKKRMQQSNAIQK